MILGQGESGWHKKKADRKCSHRFLLNNYARLAEKFQLPRLAYMKTGRTSTNYATLAEKLLWESGQHENHRRDRQHEQCDDYPRPEVSEIQSVAHAASFR